MDDGMAGGLLAWLDGGDDNMNGLRAWLDHKYGMTGIQDRMLIDMDEKEDVLDDWQRALKLAEAFYRHTAEQRSQYYAERLHNFPDAMEFDFDSIETPNTNLSYIALLDVEIRRAQFQLILAKNLHDVWCCFFESGSGLTS